MNNLYTHDSLIKSLRRSLRILSLFSIAILSFACQSGSSVVSENAATPAAPVTPAATPAASVAASAAPAAPAAATPTPAVTTAPAAQVPAPSVAQPTPSTSTRQSAGAISTELSPAKPALTPAPDPFKPRPTPSIVRQDGQIVQPWPADPQAVGVPNPFAGKAEAVATGRALYLQRCADCHGKEGKGTGWLSAQLKRDGSPIAPTNLASEVVQANSDGALFWKITNGKSPMPASRQRFTDDERWQIVAFLRTLK